MDRLQQSIDEWEDLQRRQTLQMHIESLEYRIRSTFSRMLFLRKMEEKS